MSDLSTLLLGGSIVGIGSGLTLLARGFAGYRRAGRVADTATSSIGMLAVGEVRVSGLVEPAELTLVSPLQSRTCVYFRARIREQDGRDERTVLDDERAVGFRVRDETGTIRVFPRGVSWDVPSCFTDSDGFMGETPAGVQIRMGPAIEPAMPDRDALVARLLMVHPSLDGSSFGSAARGDARARWDPLAPTARSRRRHYEEARIEPGDTVTIVGTALPFDQLPDPGGADLSEGEISGGPLAAVADPEIAADLAAARAAGTLETHPGEAWGNAAIPGFGIDQPVTPPELDSAARRSVVVDGEMADRFQRTFEIGAGELILAVGRDRPMLVSSGPASAVVVRGQDRFLVGLFGAVLAIASALVLALALSGGLSL